MQIFEKLGTKMEMMQPKKSSKPSQANRAPTTTKIVASKSSNTKLHWHGGIQTCSLSIQIVVLRIDLLGNLGYNIRLL
jgi:hypothetical protein